MQKNYDVIIVGAGPAGIMTSYELYLKNPELKVLLIDKGHDVMYRHCPIKDKKIKSCPQIKENELLAKVEPHDLIKFGLIPEFIGRVPITVTLDELDEKALKKILMEPKNALIKQYKKLFELDGIKLEFSNEAILTFAKKAIELKTGARGLRTIVESAMLPVMYTTPSKKETIKKIVMDVDDKGEVVPTIIEKQEKTSTETAA